MRKRSLYACEINRMTMITQKIAKGQRHERPCKLKQKQGKLESVLRLRILERIFHYVVEYIDFVVHSFLFIMKFYTTVSKCVHEEVLKYIVNESTFSLLLLMLRYNEKSNFLISSFFV